MRSEYGRFPSVAWAAGIITAFVLGAAAHAAETHVTVDDCLVVPKEEKDITVSARIEGEIKQVFVKQGDRVKAGQVLAQLVDDQAKLEVEIRRMEAESEIETLAAEATVKVRDFDYQAKANLFKTKAISEFELRMAEANLEVAKLQVEKSKMDRERAKVLHRLSQKRLDDYKVKSPIDGVLHEMARGAGEGVKPREPMFRILDTSAVLVEGYLDVAYLDRVREGQPVTVRVSLYKKRTFAGTIVFKDIQVESASDKFRVRAEVPNPDERIRPGLRATMTITLTRPSGKAK